MSRSGRTITIVVIVAGLLAAPVPGAAAATTIRVPATADPWAAGGRNVPDSDATDPPSVDLPAGTRVVTFPSVTGKWSFTGPYVRADGRKPDEDYGCGGDPPCVVAESHALSGLRDADRFWYLAGVFTGEARPATPPALDFTGDHDFRSLSPLLDQVFFIGNGRTSAGRLQQFVVPAGATRLWLGMPDICGPGDVADCYFDNDGSLRVTVSRGSDAPDTATAGVVSRDGEPPPGVR